MGLQPCVHALFGWMALEAQDASPFSPLRSRRAIPSAAKEVRDQAHEVIAHGSRFFCGPREIVSIAPLLVNQVLMPLGWGRTSFAGSIAMSMAYAHEIAQSEDRYVDIAERAFEMLSGAMFPGAAMVNALPICA